MAEPSPNRTLLDLVGLPPVLPDLRASLESHLHCPERLDIHRQSGSSPSLWDRKPNPTRIAHVEMAPTNTTLKVDRDLATGKANLTLTLD